MQQQRPRPQRRQRLPRRPLPRQPPLRRHSAHSSRRHRSSSRARRSSLVMIAIRIAHRVRPPSIFYFLFCSLRCRIFGHVLGLVFDLPSKLQLRFACDNHIDKRRLQFRGQSVTAGAIEPVGGMVSHALVQAFAYGSFMVQHDKVWSVVKSVTTTNFRLRLVRCRAVTSTRPSLGR